MNRFVLGLLVGALVVTGAYVGWQRLGKDDRITIQGQIVIQDPHMVYANGTPSAVYQGGVDNGCSDPGYGIGSPVYVDDAQGKTVATGKIVSTFHWENDPELQVSRLNNGCDFTYRVTGVPKLDSYDIWSGILARVSDVKWNDLSYTKLDSEAVYIAPPMNFP